MNKPGLRKLLLLSLVFLVTALASVSLLAAILPQSLVALIMLGPVDPIITATMVDALSVDNPPLGQADPGDTILYTVVISNTGSADATDVIFTDTIDLNTTLVAGSVKTTPIARNDSHAVTGNVQISVAAPGVLANDNDPDGGAITAVAIVGGSSTNGGDVDLATDGSFTYNPPPGFEGTDTFSYTIEDADGNPDSATVTLAVDDMIWFIDNSAAGPGDGRLTSPFTGLAVTSNSFDVNATDDPGDNIFLAAGFYAGGLTLLDDQKLIGDGSSGMLEAATGITLAPDSDPLPTFSGTDPLIASNTDGIILSGDNTIRGLTIGNTIGTGLIGTNVGSLTVGETTISGFGQAIDLDTAPFTLSVTFDSLSSSGGSRGINLSNLSGGSFIVNDTTVIDNATVAGIEITNSIDPLILFLGPVDINNTGGDGVSLSNNLGSLIIFFGGLTIDTTTGTGLLVSNADLDVTNGPNPNTITATSGKAMDLDGVFTGGISFDSISSTNSASEGIRINNVTAFGDVEVTGTTAVTASSGDGVSLSNNAGSNFTFADLDIDNFSTNQRGLFASTSGTLTISDGDIDGGSASGVDIDGTDLNVTLTSVTSIGGSTAGIDLNTTTGSFTVTGSGTAGSGGTIANKTGGDGTNNGIGVLLNSASSVSLSRMQLNDFTNFAIRGSNVTGFDLLDSVVDGVNGTSAAVDEGSVRFDNLTGTSNFTNDTISGGLEDNLNVVNSSGTLNRLTVSGGTIGLNDTSLGNDGIFAESQSTATLNVTVSGVTFLGARGDLLRTNTLDDSTMDIVVQDNTFQNAHTNIVSAGGGITLSGGSGGGNITVTYDVSGTTAGAQTFRDADGNAITINYLDGAGTVSGTVMNNNIGVTSVTGSGSANGSGMLLSSGGSLTHTVTIDNNDIRSIGGFAGLEISANSTSTLNATVTNNTIDEMSGFVLAGMYYLAGGGAGDTSTLCSDIQNNTVDASGVAFASSVFFDQISGSANHNLPGYAGSPHGEFGFPSTGTASVDIESYLLGRGNSLTAGASAFFNVDASLVQGVTGNGTTCPLMAARGQGPGGVDSLSKEPLAAVAAKAIERWSANGLSQAERIRLQRAMIEIVDLPDGQLGSTSMMRIAIDHDGAGYGWSTDKTAAGKMDLLTVVLHELGHVLGKTHTNAPDLMAETLETGVRRRPPIARPALRVVTSESQLSAAPGERSQRAAPAEVPTEDELPCIVEAAVARWAALGISADERARLEELVRSMVDRPGLFLGSATASELVVDADGGGYGWFVDLTPGEDEEFEEAGSARELQAGASSPAAGRMDLLTTVMHELGHVLGLHHTAGPNGLMSDVLVPGVRRLPKPALDPSRQPMTPADGEYRLQATGAQAAALVAMTTPLSGETVMVDLGLMNPGQTVTITFEASIDDPLPPGTTEVSNQGTFTGSNFTDVLTDDPNEPGAADPTVTPVVVPKVVPAVSQWAFAALVLLMLAAGRGVLRSRRNAAR